MWAVASTVTTPEAPAVVYACDAPALGAVTALPGGASASAGRDGSVCVHGDDVTMSLPADVEPGLVLTYDGPDGTWDVGVAQAGDHLAVELHAVEGSGVQLWVARR